MNARAGFGFGKAWRVDAFVNNITNQRRGDLGFHHARSGTRPRLFRGPARAIGAEFNYSFKDHETPRRSSGSGSIALQLLEARNNPFFQLAHRLSHSFHGRRQEIVGVDCGCRDVESCTSRPSSRSASTVGMSPRAIP